MSRHPAYSAISSGYLQRCVYVSMLTLMTIWHKKKSGGHAKAYYSTNAELHSCRYTEPRSGTKANTEKQCIF
jgi:hypothetical protein